MRTRERRQVLRETLTTGEVADYLGSSERFARGLIASGALPSLKIGALRRVRRSDLDEFVAQRVLEEGRDRA